MNAWVLLLIALAPAAGWQLQTYEDPEKRFTFRYPAVFGQPERGTDDGFRERVAAVRFAKVNLEAVLTQGPVTVDRQAIGGLYDTMARQVIPEAALPRILQALAPVTADSFCDLLAATTHIARPETLSAKELQMARAADGLGHDAPRVLVCRRAGDTVTFHKEAGIGPGGGRRHVFGAIRFLPAPYSSFQIVGVGAAPASGDLDAMRSVVASFSRRE